MGFTLGDTGKTLVFAVITVVGTIGSALAAFRLGWMPADRDAEAGVVTVLLILWGALAWWLAHRFPDPPEPVEETPEALLEQGLVEVQEMGVVRAFEIRPFEDLGPNFFLEFDDGRVAYCGGPWLEDLVEDPAEDPDAGESEQERGPGRTFPNTRMRVLLHRRDRSLVDAKMLGDYLLPERVLPACSRHQLKEVPWQAFLFMEESYDTLITRYTALLGGGPASQL
jgi:hypothetical protein